MSYFASYRSTDGKTLVGGVLQSQTSRFQKREDAQLRLDQIKELNGAHCEGEIHSSPFAPEIFVHCGTIATAIHCKCPGCGKMLTIQDAHETN